MTDLVQAALASAELGYRVFPCAAETNPAPLTPQGFKNATTDANQIERWWRRYPNACIGIATEGLLVIDVDAPPNPWLSDRPELAAELLSAPTSVTPGGGRHHFFRRPAGKTWKCTVGRLAPHVDTRTDGGYVVIPPSVRSDGSYRWIEGCEIDTGIEGLPEPPGWLIEQLDIVGSDLRITSNEASAPGHENLIPSGQRNGALARLAGTMRRAGMSQPEIVAAIHETNLLRCRPPLGRDEVERIAASISRYEPDQITVALIEDHWQQLKNGSPKVRFNAITSPELDAGQYELEYLINGILVRGQPGVIAGPKKTLKTNISIDLALSLAEATKFLGRFDVKLNARVGVMSGESGAATIQETARRVAKAKQLELRNCDGAVWCFDVPQLGQHDHIEALGNLIADHNLDVLILDPTYLMMLGIGNDASNLFVVGGLLKSLGELAQRTGCTPLLCHHLRKGVSEPYEPAELENIAWAGFQEFVRQWILLNRRVRYDPQRGGHHELWMSVGGSAGHSGLWGINVEEGVRDDLGGRRWDVEVIDAAQAYQQRDDTVDLESEEKQERRKQSKFERNRVRILEILTSNPDGDSLRSISAEAGLRDSTTKTILEDLIAEGCVQRCDCTKGKSKFHGFRLAQTNDLFTALERAAPVVNMAPGDALKRAAPMGDASPGDA